ncbi:HesA/MoeB/ThiF family protein [Sphingomonas sp. 8AM]|uniref:HesA/MoeB/ThiF family protein n=1 Tax=Sphingomonas sp. 8AM TaxID=2653170 RepID=UPI0012F1B401|nr:HesA/MoeB/ThiF family protein [Sphingomonas sp. 8AM]VXD03061.1 SAMP-activating enzyme E1 [Sphingomonas sp. 8AM]
MTLGADELGRYARHIVLQEIGGSGQLRLSRAHVLVIGAGGIGSPVIQYLAAAGVGRLTIVDDDRVELSNLQRQTSFATADVGRQKADVAAEVVTRLNPHVAVHAVITRVGRENVGALLEDAPSVIVDGCDNFETRLLVADAALAHRIPLVSAAVGRFEGQLGVYRGWEADKPCYRCFVGDAPARDALTCAEEGVLGPVTGIVGSMAALEAIRQIAPFGDDSAGRLMLLDFLSLRFRTLALPPDPACRACGATRG